MHNVDVLGEAEKFLHERIPLTRAMGVRVVRSDEAGFAIEAPVSANSNHLATAFGGSINAVATLAAYGLLWLELRGENAEVVISESAIRFHRPIRHVIQAICARPEASLLQEFLGALRTKGRARLTLRVQVVEEERVAAEFTGTFVASLPTNSRKSVHPSAVIMT